MSPTRRWSIAVLAMSALALGGCSSPSTSSPTTTTATPTTSAGSSASIASIPAQDRSATGIAGSEPAITVPAGAPPTQLESADMITGTGPAAKAGDTVMVQYVLATYSSRKVVQSSWTSQPFQFTLGAGQVITGWDQGVAGMQKGGRRELIIPSSLGYGAQSPAPGIASNDTLVFIVDLLKVN